MQLQEFEAWVAGHVAAFGGLKTWLRDNPECAAAWRECLADVPLADAKEATRLLNVGEEEAPRGYGDHARAVRRIALRLALDRRPETPRPCYVDGQRTYRCPTCLDDGVVLVANIWKTPAGGRPLRSYSAGSSQRLPQCAVGCDCGAPRPPGLETLDRERMFVLNVLESAEDEAQRFAAWWESGARFGRHGVFDDWNEPQRVTT